MEAVASLHGFAIDFSMADLGGIAIDNSGAPYPDSTKDLAKAADAILLGAVGGPAWDSLPAAERPERGLLAIRADLDLFCNLRPALLYPQLADASSLKPELVAGLDLLIVRGSQVGFILESRVASRPTNLDYAEDSTPMFTTKLKSGALHIWPFSLPENGVVVCARLIRRTYWK